MEISSTIIYENDMLIHSNPSASMIDPACLHSATKKLLCGRRNVRIILVTLESPFLIGATVWNFDIFELVVLRETLVNALCKRKYQANRLALKTVRLFIFALCYYLFTDLWHVKIIAIMMFLRIICKNMIKLLGDRDVTNVIVTKTVQTCDNKFQPFDTFVTHVLARK